jgi:hypothetical protein
VEGAGGFALCTNLHLPPDTNLALYNSAIKQEDPNCQIETKMNEPIGPTFSVLHTPELNFGQTIMG